MFYKHLINSSPIKKRYLLQFGYIGTQFWGVQRQVPYNLKDHTDLHTVQGLLEYALQQLNPNNKVKLCVSSRTDSGVHSFRTTAHVDLSFYYDHMHNPYKICKTVNKYFQESQLDIRLHNVRHVNDNFHARFNAIWRKYVYRMAVVKEGKYIDKKSQNVTLPLTEHNRCLFVLDHPFKNIESAKECAKLIVGTHDFLSFMAKNNEIQPGDVTLRTIHSFDIAPGRSFFESEWDNPFQYWTFTCIGRSFLYKQIRKLVTAMMYVAQERMSFEEFKYMLDNPSLGNWSDKLHLIPGYGLYLIDVGYREKDLVVPKDIRYALVLNSMKSNNKLEVIKLIKELHGSCTTLQARDMLNTLPIVIRKNLVEREAVFYKELFSKIQCEAHLEKSELEDDETCKYEEFAADMKS